MGGVFIVLTAIIMMFTLIVPPLFGADRQTQSPSERHVSLPEGIQVAADNNLSVRLLGSGTVRLEQVERGARR